jgi:hypothetical protein
VLACLRTAQGGSAVAAVLQAPQLVNLALSHLSHDPPSFVSSLCQVLLDKVFCTSAFRSCLARCMLHMRCQCYPRVFKGSRMHAVPLVFLSEGELLHHCTCSPRILPAFKGQRIIFHSLQMLSIACQLIVPCLDFTERCTQVGKERERGGRYNGRDKNKQCCSTFQAD